MLAPEDIERLKEIFVTRQECQDTNRELEEKISSTATDLAVIKQQLQVIAWVSKTTLAAVIVAVVGAIMALILK